MNAAQALWPDKRFHDWRLQRWTCGPLDSPAQEEARFVLGPLEIAAAAAALAAAGFTIGIVGFGIGLITAPILLLILDPQTTVVAVNAAAVVAFGLVLVETRGHADYRQLIPTAAAGMLGTPFGVYALGALDPSILRIGITALVLALTALVIVKTEWRIPKPRITGPILGFGVAAMVTGLSIGGPLLALFLIGQGMERQRVRASMAFFFTIMYSAAAVGYAVQGLFDAERLILAAAAAPAAALGYWLSTRISSRMNETAFRRAVVAVIAITSTLVLAREAAAI